MRESLSSPSYPLHRVSPLDSAYDCDMDTDIPVWAREVFNLETFKVDEVTVPCLVGGNGPSLIMIHGLGGSLEWWRYNANELAEHFTVYMFDLPGFGRLGQLPASGSMPFYTGWTHRLLKEIGLDRVHVLGHSMGGHIALRLAAGFPEHVDKLVLVAPAGVLPDAEIEHYVLPVLKLLREIPPKLLPLALKDIRRADLRTTWRSGQDLIENDVLPLLPSVQSPVLLIWGDQDDITPFDLSATFLNRLSDVRLARFPNIGHLPMVESVQEFNREVINFLIPNPE
jgi:pimeloyl-ACP methyl ester carboxylesterase